jgi:putative Ca2+/H+ antiporter (TMEM165/GDT1 family)
MVGIALSFTWNPRGKRVGFEILSVEQVVLKQLTGGVSLAAQYNAFFAVIAGTTLGMMIANVPAVLLGDLITNRVPIRLVHSIAAAIFAILGVATLLGVGARLGL